MYAGTDRRRDPPRPTLSPLPSSAALLLKLSPLTQPINLAHAVGSPCNDQTNAGKGVESADLDYVPKQILRSASDEF